MSICSRSRHGTGDEAKKIIEEKPYIIISRLSNDLDEGILYEGIHSEDFRRDLLWLITRRQTIKGLHGNLVCLPRTVSQNSEIRGAAPGEIPGAEG